MAFGLALSLGLVVAVLLSCPQLHGALPELSGFCFGRGSAFEGRACSLRPLPEEILVLLLFVDELPLHVRRIPEPYFGMSFSIPGNERSASNTSTLVGCGCSDTLQRFYRCVFFSWIFAC